MYVTKSEFIEMLRDLLSKVGQSDALSVGEKYRVIRPLLPVGSDVFSSQEGEDILVKRLLKSNYFKQGFFVDVGAYDPVKLSNTFHYYLRGWRGINIDPNPIMKERFDDVRPLDINVNMGVSSHGGSLAYHMFKEGAFNTFSSEQAQSIIDSNKSEYLGVQTVQVDKLSEILSDNLPDKQKITYMNIDVEGWEIEILESNDWSKYKPYFITIEALNQEKTEDIISILNSEGYLQVAKTKNTLFFVLKHIYEDLEHDLDIDVSLVLPATQKDEDRKVDLSQFAGSIKQHLVKEKKQEIERLTKEKKQEIERIIASPSYRIGRAITSPIRLIRRLL